MEPKPLHLNALRLYDKMEEQAQSHEDGHFHGSIVQLFATLGISNGSYSPITGLLKQMGAITQLQRGARGIESVYQLGGRPTVEDLLSTVVSSPSDLTKLTKADMLVVVQQLTDIEKRIGRLDIVEALVNIERRISALEQKESNVTKS